MIHFISIRVLTIILQCLCSAVISQILSVLLPSGSVILVADVVPGFDVADVVVAKVPCIGVFVEVVPG